MNRKYTPKTKIHLEIWWPKSIGQFYIITKTQTLHLRCFITRSLKYIAKHFRKFEIKSVYYVRKLWLTCGLKKSIKIKDKLYAIMSSKKTAYNENIYKNYRNRLHKLLKNAERNYYNDQMLTNRNDIWKTWSIIKTIINKNKGDQSKQTNFMLSDRSVTDDKQAVVEKFNDFF